MTMPTTDVTTVIATRNGADRLLRLMPCHTGPVIVVDNGSDDGSPERVARRYPRIPLIRLGRNAGAAARNIGAAQAATPYVAFADDDSYWMGDSVDRAAAILRGHPTVGLLTATVLVGPERRTDPLSAGMAAAPLGVPSGEPGPAVLGFLACAIVVRRHAFLDVGGFNARLHIYGEEDLLALDLAAAGWSLNYVRELYVHHLPSPGRSESGGPSPDRGAQPDPDRGAPPAAGSGCAYGGRRGGPPRRTPRHSCRDARVAVGGGAPAPCAGAGGERPVGVGPVGHGRLTALAVAALRRRSRSPPSAPAAAQVERDQRVGREPRRRRARSRTRSWSPIMAGGRRSPGLRRVR